ncbi:hypothetical protein D3C74_83610 [compost metagenome]
MKNENQRPLINLEPLLKQPVKALDDFDSLTSEEQIAFYQILLSFIVSEDKLQELYNMLKDASIYGEHHFTQGLEAEASSMFNLLQKFIVDSGGNDLPNYELAYAEHRKAAELRKDAVQEYDETDELVYY